MKAIGKVVVTDSRFPALEREKAVAARHGLALESHQCGDATEVREAVRGARAVLVQFAPLDAQAVAGLAPGATIVRYGVGHDNLDVRAAQAAGHRVCYVPDYCTTEVADHTAALILAGLRRLPQLDASVRAGEWNAVGVSRPLPPLDCCVLGLVGLGRIGQALLERLRPFGFKLAVCDPALSAGQATALGVRRLSLVSLLSQADVVSLHLPVTPETRHLLDGDRLALMRPEALLVNCSRGELIDEVALAAALKAGRLRAALDVFAQEPLPADSPLRTAPNLILTPHAAWFSDRAMDRLQELAADEIDRGLAGRPPRCPVPAPVD